METAYKIIIWVLLFILGSSIYSFLNVIIYRVPKGMNFIKGHSMCPECKHTLKAADLIPVLSYIMLRGRCRYCGEKIGIRDTLIEIAGGALAVLCAWCRRGDPLGAVMIYAFISVLTVVYFIDMDTMEIPDGCHIAIAVLAVAVTVLDMFSQGTFLSGIYTPTGITIIQRLIGLICISLPMLIIALVIPGAFGGGDIKLMAAGGLFLGVRLTVVSAVLAVLAGGTWGIILLASRKKGRKEHFAFGPFLAAGMVLSIFAGDALAGWYMGFLQF